MEGFLFLITCNLFRLCFSRPNIGGSLELGYIQHGHLNVNAMRVSMSI